METTQQSDSEIVVRRFRNPCGDRRPDNAAVATGALFEAVQPLRNVVLDTRQLRSLRCAGVGSFGGRICNARRRLSGRCGSGRCGGRCGSGRCGSGSCATARGRVGGHEHVPIAWIRILALIPSRRLRLCPIYLGPVHRRVWHLSRGALVLVGVLAVLVLALLRRRRRLVVFRILVALLRHLPRAIVIRLRYLLRRELASTGTGQWRVVVLVVLVLVLVLVLLVLVLVVLVFVVLILVVLLLVVVVVLVGPVGLVKLPVSVSSLSLWFSSLSRARVQSSICWVLITWARLR